MLRSLRQFLWNRLLDAAGFLRASMREGRNTTLHTFLLFKDLVKMVDVNDFGRYVSKNLGKRFIALSGVVTLFALIGQYTKILVIGGEEDVTFKTHVIQNIVANFIFFGVPGGFLLLITQVFSFFNRSNYFTAQAAYLNCLETSKRTPAQLEKVIDMLWSSVYEPEIPLFARECGQEEMCRKVREIQQRKVREEAELIHEVTKQLEGPSKARTKYEAFIDKARPEGYLRLLPWREMSIRERCNAIGRIIKEETVEEILREDLLFCEIGFKFNAGWSLSSPAHLNLKHRKSGIDLKLVEDWLDGAFFDITDTKLIEQYIAEATLKSIKLQARVPVVRLIMIQGFRNLFQRIWTYMVFGITSKRLGRYLNHLNNKYVREESDRFDRDYFKAEAFFWPSEAYDQEIRDEIGDQALARLRVLRERWLFLTLGRLKRPRVHAGMSAEELRRRLDKNTDAALRSARRLLKRMFAGSVYNIHELRLLYDPDYVLWMGERDEWELERMGLSETYIERHRRSVMRRRDEVLRFQRYLDELLVPEEIKRHRVELEFDEEFKRAIRVAYHVNERGLKRWVDKELKHGSTPLLRRQIYDLIKSVAEMKRSHSRKIRQLKIFETLAILHLKNYMDTVEGLYRNIQTAFREELEGRLERKKEARKA